jgi:hypothetical protein
VTGGGLAFAVVVLLVIAISVVIWAMTGSMKRMNRNVSTGQFQQTSNEQAVRRAERARRNRLVRFLVRPPGSARRTGLPPRSGSAQAAQREPETYPGSRTPPPTA